MLFEFKIFKDGMLSKMDEQNKLLSHLVLSQKSNYTSFPTFQSIKIKHDKFENKSNRDQCEVMEHSIEVPELFHDPYPFEKFEVNQLPHLEKGSLKFYKEQLKFSDKDKALAFYFFEHRNLSAGVKAGIKTAYNQYKLKNSIFIIDNLKNFFANLDIAKVLFGFEDNFEDIFIFGTSVFTFGSVDFHMKFWSEPKVKADVPKVKSLWESSSKPNKTLMHDKFKLAFTLGENEAIRNTFFRY